MIQGTREGKRPVVVTLTGCYLPGYKAGGHVQTIANMVLHLADTVDFRIITKDRDKTEVAPYPSIVPGEWNDVGPAKVLYLPPSSMNLRSIAGHINEVDYDVLYLQGFYDYELTLRALASRQLGWIRRDPVVIAPRGEFSPGALTLKRWKKAPYLKAAKLIGLYRNLVWQASTETEAVNIRRSLGEAIASKIVVAPDLLPPPSSLPPHHWKPAAAQDGPLRIIFLSRISRMKNLDYALRVLQRTSTPIVFDIYGPESDPGYWDECRSLMAQMPSHVVARYKGVIPHPKIYDVLSEYDLFFLPTRGENFGHVICESLAVGTPPLIADTTPWNDLEDKQVGYVRSLADPDSFIAAIEKHANTASEDRLRQRQAAIEYARIVAYDQDAISRNASLFTSLV